MVIRLSPLDLEIHRFRHIFRDQVALLRHRALVPARRRRDRRDRLPAAALGGEGGELAADAAGGEDGWRGKGF